MKTIITILKCTIKAVTITVLLFVLNACQEEPIFVEEAPVLDYSSQGVQNNYSTDEETDSLIFSLDFENGLLTHDSESPSMAGDINFTSGISGEGICFGRYDTLQYLANGNINHSEGSLSVWIKPNWEPGHNLYKILYYGRNPKHFEMHVDENSLVAFGLNSASMQEKQIKVAFGDASYWGKGDWHHIAYSWSSEKISLYIDGYLMESTHVGYDIPEVSDEIFHIGSDNGFEGFNGVIDEFRIFSNQLSDSDVLELFHEFSSNIGEAYVEDCENVDDGDSNPIKYEFAIEILSGSLIGNSYDGHFNLDIADLDSSCMDTLQIETMHLNYQNRCFTEENMDYQPFVVFNRGELQDLYLVGGPNELRFGINDGFHRSQFGREEEQWIRDGGSYFGYLDEYTYVDGAGIITYSKAEEETNF